MPDFRELSRPVAGLTVLVTGAASGMGRATARVFAAEGANVAVTDYAAEGAQTVGRPMSLPARQSILLRNRLLRRWMDARIKSGHDSCVRRGACETLTSRCQGVAFCPKRSGNNRIPDQEKTP
jgi:NAD(P)-dependent dehydrogenase (short-subunit alcohol dehydrogenase family)